MEILAIILLAFLIFTNYCLALKVQTLELQIEDLNFEAHSINEELYDLRSED